MKHELLLKLETNLAAILCRKNKKTNNKKTNNTNRLIDGRISFCRRPLPPPPPTHITPDPNLSPRRNHLFFRTEIQPVTISSPTTVIISSQDPNSLPILPTILFLQKWGPVTTSAIAIRQSFNRKPLPRTPSTVTLPRNPPTLCSCRVASKPTSRRRTSAGQFCIHLNTPSCRIP